MRIAVLAPLRALPAAPPGLATRRNAATADRHRDAPWGNPGQGSRWLEVPWPTTGATGVFEDVPLDLGARGTEGADELEARDLPPLDRARTEDAGDGR